MNGKLTTKLTSINFTDKWSRDPAIVELYRAHDDYLTAYAKHTDLRVQADPHQAVGGNWESTIERDLLIEQGLRPEHTLLDFACGTGRLARQIVPYLNDRELYRRRYFCGSDLRIVGA